MKNEVIGDNIPRLCYLKDGIMYFTNDVHNVCGDNWDDAPYEHNAGEPYERYVTAMLAFHPSKNTDMYYEPYERGEYSVEEINNGAIPWLYCDSAGPLQAGATRIECITWLDKAHMVWGELEQHE